MNDISHLIAQKLHDIYGIEHTVDLTRPDAQFGDYATNIALQVAKELGKSPREIAETLAEALRRELIFSEVSVAGPGFEQ